MATEPGPTGAGVDLEKELTCAICTELLYQPLTLLDCLHTFCGACLKEWFAWQAVAAEKKPPPSLLEGGSVFTCPSCRAGVRETRHNATFATLLDMFLRAKPEKGRSEKEKVELGRRYTRGEKVLPEMRVVAMISERERRAEEADRRLLEEVRAMSLREVTGMGRETSVGRRERARRRDDVAGEHFGENVSSQERWRRSGGSDGRQVEHQTSLHLLIRSTGTMDAHEMEREVEAFARQIQEEGLLDGLDLDNINLQDNDELSRKISEAYRRRYRGRSRHNGDRRRNASARSHGSEERQDGQASASTSSSWQTEERGRYGPSSSTHLEVYEPRRQRRTASGSGRSTEPRTPDAPPAARAQRDSAVSWSRGGEAAAGPRTETAMTTAATHAFAPPGNDLCSARVFRAERGSYNDRRALAAGPAMATGASEDSGRYSPPSLAPRSRPHLLGDGSVGCMRCGKQHIEHELHYSCRLCHAGRWNMCLDCYRRGKGCLHWFGFGHGALQKWHRERRAGHDANMAKPHRLTANRYKPGNVSGGRSGTTLSAADRLQSGSFCQRCFAWANDCYWTCDVCNDGDWGFCNACVNRGLCCTHPLLPLAFQPARLPAELDAPQAGPAVAAVPPEAHIAGPGGFRPLAATPRCAVCCKTIPATQQHYHCYECVDDECVVAAGVRSNGSSSPPRGHNDMCETCYAGLISRGHVTTENGPDGWRRCLLGHRMAVVASQDGRGGPRRCVVREPVGGRRLRLEDTATEGLLLARWVDGDSRRRVERLVSRDVAIPSAALAAPPSPAAEAERVADRFPPDGGPGMCGAAMWAWWRSKAEADDELEFPRGAVISEIEDANGDWFHGWYMGAQGLFPAPYLALLA